MAARTVKRPTQLNVYIPLAVLYLIYTTLNQREIYIKQFYSSKLLIIVYETYGNRYSLFSIYKKIVIDMIKLD